MAVDTRGWYTRCPECGWIAPPSSMDYGVTADCAAVDWERPATASCMCCHATYAISEADLLALDSEMTCHRCEAAVACPAGAARAQCTGCGLLLLGAELSERQVGDLTATEGAAARALRARYIAARARAGMGREKPR